MPMEIPTDLTPELVPLSWLIGTWEGSGRLGEGEADSEHFAQKVTFTQNGLPYLQYTAESWLTDEQGTRLRPLAVETGFWSLDRPLNDADGGPGLVPADIVPALRSADEVEELRNENGGFDITATIVHPGGIAELYYGQIKGPQIQLATDLVMRGVNSKEYTAATRIFGLVNGDLYWRWDVASEGENLKAHASAILNKSS
ncbi:MULTISPECIES: FABP family protein [unclassified Arthrobacter]|uniref:FABP family protein n=1 Tax=unclassified Arthrobacter TaxID=235627 RepID=UPI001D13438D|nr:MULTISPECIES: FABP family protein [unclassified Arthrobacter]MCC3276045.1 FABP family protein [Arthrobacter sp. zg-Y20]MCC9176370.1 FABP family protein [Arthrobacter sp. zg-Y750]MDK1316202.1 FABP family protein [Arthrobacter sp. zg.Y20]MDK1326929.1 FABP family protein [Arthrobacter sp. zg-Y1143]WIB05519.1 FABP family protein [Arthrobacter sp. zg-Y20]